MAEYDLDGWIAKELLNPDDINIFLVLTDSAARRRAEWLLGSLLF